MTFSLFAALVVVASSRAPVSIAVGGVEAAGLDEKVVRALFERFDVLLSEGGRIRVITPQDVAQVIGLERQKALMTCTDTSCLAEFIGGLGADGLLRASVIHSGTSYTATIKVIRTRDGSLWASATERLSSEDALQSWLDDTARAMAQTLAPAPTAIAVGVPWLRLVPGVVGLAAGVGSAVAFIGSANAAARLSTESSLTSTDIAETMRSGQSMELAGFALGTVAVAGVATSLVWLVVGASESEPAVSTSAAVVPGGATFMVRGRF